MPCTLTYPAFSDENGANINMHIFNTNIGHSLIQLEIGRTIPAS